MPSDFSIIPESSALCTWRHYIVYLYVATYFYYYLPHVVCWPLLLLGHLLTRFRASLTLHAHLCLCALFLFSFTIHNIVSNQERSHNIISVVTHPLAMQLINATFTSFTFFHLGTSIVVASTGNAASYRQCSSADQGAGQSSRRRGMSTLRCVRVRR